MTTVAVIGLGTMGAGIAATMARAGVTVRATDVRPEACDKARSDLPAIAGVLDALGMPVKGDATSVTLCRTLAETVAGADMVLENVPEKLELKLEVFKQIDALVGADCILASDTSGIPITKLQSAVRHPRRMVGMHWSNPPHIIPMIEVIAGARTAPETAEWMMAFIRGLGLLPVRVARDVPGFVENRILYAIMREALDLVDSGVIGAEDLDTCVSWGIGYKLAVIGPMALLDMAGLDIYQSVASYLNETLSTRSDVSPAITDRTADGKLGIKSGAGMFDYGATDVAALRAARARAFVAVRRALESNAIKEMPQ
ncbi:MAG: 3-hydroxyacyl-CoA dehydrogenase NAD-binding domain-containing protein [Alphaproteobacteria bacterium]